MNKCSVGRLWSKTVTSSGSTRRFSGWGRRSMPRSRNTTTRFTAARREGNADEIFSLSEAVAFAVRRPGSLGPLCFCGAGFEQCRFFGARIDDRGTIRRPPTPGNRTRVGTAALGCPAARVYRAAVTPACPAAWGQAGMLFTPLSPCAKAKAARNFRAAWAGQRTRPYMDLAEVRRLTSDAVRGLP